MTIPLNFLITDFETTGLDPIKHTITEIGMIGVDADFNELFRYSQVLQLDPAHWLDFGGIPLEMAAANGLLRDLEAPVYRPDLAEAESEIMAILADYAPSESRGFVVGGSGVGTHDIQFIRRQMPKLAAAITYYPHDSGVIRREWKRATGHDISAANESKTHRALDDCVAHLEEARAIRETFAVLGASLYADVR